MTKSSSIDIKLEVMAESDVEIKIIGVTSMTDSAIGVEKPKIVENLWCNLPDNVSISILERLCYVDQIHFRAVCKSWRLKIYGKVRYANKFPWILAIEGERFLPIFESPRLISMSNKCCLYDPIHKQKYTIQNKVLVGANIHASKYGWLLLSKETPDYRTYLFSFYNPFTNEIIRLPALKMKISGKIFSCGKATFSTSPASSDCMICVVSTESSFYEEFCVSTYSPRGGNKTWNNVLLGMNRYKCDTRITRVVYTDGVFYFTFAEKGNVMGAFKPGLKEWKAYPYPKNVSPSSMDYMSLIESHDNDENLLIAHRHLYRDTWDIYRFNNKMETEREMDWCQIEKLESRMLFVSATSTSLQLEGMGSLANTIHVAENRHGQACSFQLHTKLVKREQCPQQIFDWIIQKKGRPQPISSLPGPYGISNAAYSSAQFGLAGTMTPMGIASVPSTNTSLPFNLGDLLRASLNASFTTYGGGGGHYDMRPVSSSDNNSESSRHRP
ncbi:hypothetical protein EZV62_007070 [Acer yangbiense]|uniref:F-box domain-containing protein n=1 Tax=Acer yangbiense TaxID=1000413 RepID=A0A5C7I980_9ROSI|nr:hypothetical protein EZV62_007070 [Acer yangbiense]